MGGMAQLQPWQRGGMATVTVQWCTAESWSEIDIIILKSCDSNQLKFGQFRNKMCC